MFSLTRVPRAARLRALANTRHCAPPHARRLASVDGALLPQPAEQPAEPAEPAEPAKPSNPVSDAVLAPEDASVPWYMRRDVKAALAAEPAPEIPAVPLHAPAHVPAFLRLLATDYGMTDLLLFDMAALDESHEYRANNRSVDFIVVATGKSERHILKAATEFRTHIKHTYHVVPAAEGVVSTAKTPAMRRKLLRRARKGPSATDNEFGRSANSWVLFHHDGVDVHILTADRRRDLNLESLWCPPEDAHLYAQAPAAPAESDHIFSGIRYLHTRAGASHGAPAQHLERLLAQPAGAATTDLVRCREQFDDAFVGLCVADFRAKYAFYKAVHVLNPGVVAFADAEAALLEKYASPVAAGDMAAEKIDDVCEYARLLLDSPAECARSKKDTDTALDKLAQFVAVLYRFSPDKFSMSANPDFIPLLWRMTFCETGPVVTPRDVEDFISGNEVVVASTGDPLVTLASNNARDVLALLDYSNRVADNGSSLTPQFKEHVMYTYGNAGKWAEFWKEWDGVFFPASLLPESALQHWVRLVVFLLLVANRAQSLFFLNHYWENGTAVSGTFSECLAANGNRFGSEAEQRAFCRAMGLMVDSLDPRKDVYMQIRKQLADMDVTG